MVSQMKKPINFGKLYNERFEICGSQLGALNLFLFI